MTLITVLTIPEDDRHPTGRAHAHPDAGGSVHAMVASAAAGHGAVEGIDAGGVEAWFADTVPGVELPLAFELIAGGRSNLTYQVTDGAGRRYALRRPPLSHVLPTAHDMAREYRVITALGPTAVPVPVTFGLCLDETVNGRPFYVMEFVDGHIVRDAETAERDLDLSARRRAGESMADTLAALHAVDVDAVGLGDFAKRDGYIERQLRRWYQQFQNSAVPGVDTGSIITTVHDKLAADIPVQVGTAIVHGDYRLDNSVLGPDGSVRAVLDWEICTLGDPLADLGLLMVYWTEAGDEAAILGVTPTTVPGFPGRAEVRARYQAASGRDISRLDFYVAFGYWKLACILQGVYARYVGGAGAGDRSSVDGYGDSVVRLAEMALRTLEST
jgi:aminoglycoside phosphotransferase (APT) family kinase protein